MVGDSLEGERITLAKFIITVCLAGNPGVCKKVELEPASGPMGCIVQGQAPAAQYYEDHAGRWEVKRLECHLPGRGEK